MPLKCLKDDESEILSFQLSEVEWEELRAENKRLKNLKMPCCGAFVTLRRSKRGTPFFAHVKTGPCSTKPETAEHLLAKCQIAEAIGATDWLVTTEKRGSAPDGTLWIADVYATKGSAAIAFEVQWSKQSDVETSARQLAYKNSGVRGLWLFRQEELDSSSDIPAFQLLFSEDNGGSFTVQIQAGHYGKQLVDLRLFITGALKGALKFAPCKGRELPVEVWGHDIDCWKCKRSTNIITHFNVAAS